MSTDEGLRPVTIPIDAARRLAKDLPKRSHLPVLRHAFVQVAATNADGTFRALTTDLESTRPLAVRKVPAEYPDWQRCYPKRQAKSVVHVNPALLARVCTLATKWGAASLRLELRQDTDPIVLAGRTGESAPVLFLVMPMRAPKGEQS